MQEPFEELRILDMGERIKHMNVVSEAEGIYYLLKGLSLQVFANRALPLLEKSVSIFEELLTYDPNNSFSLRHCAEALSLIGFLKTKDINTHNDPNFIKAIDLFEKATTACPTDKIAFLLWAKSLYKLANYEEAEDLFLKSLEIDPNYPVSLENYARLLNRKKLDSEAKLVLERLQSVLND